MTLKQYLILMCLGTALSWAAVGLIIAMIDPADAHALTFIVFYASMFLALAGTISVIGLAMRVLLLKKDFLISRQVFISFRQAVLLSLMLVAALILQSKSLLTVWTAVLLAAVLTVMEFFFISTKVRQ